jgi:hypothetical protein
VNPKIPESAAERNKKQNHPQKKKRADRFRDPFKNNQRSRSCHKTHLSPGSMSDDPFHSHFQKLRKSKQTESKSKQKLQKTRRVSDELGLNQLPYDFVALPHPLLRHHPMSSHMEREMMPLSSLLKQLLTDQ